MNKREELKKRIIDENPDIILLTEIYPKYEHTISAILEYKVDGYTLDFNSNFSRGVAIYIKDTIDILPCEIKELDNVNENLWTLIKIDDTNILIGCIYRSDSIKKETSINHLIEMFDNILKSKIKYDKLIISGDFNLKEIHWEDITNSPGELDNKFIKCLQDHFLEQIINTPTRHREKQKSNILDLVFTLDKNDINNVRHLDPLGKSDHEVLAIELNLPKPNPPGKKTKLDFSKMDTEGFRQYLSECKWDQLDTLNCQESIDKVYNILNVGIDKFVPLKTVKASKSKQPWLNSSCHKNAKKKYLLYKRFLQTKSSYYYKQYINQRNLLKKLIRKSVRDYEQHVSANSKTSVKEFWKYVNSKLKRTTGLSNLTKPDGTLTTSDEEICTLLNDFFISVLTKENLKDMPVPENKNNDIFLSDIIITSKAVHDKLIKLDPHKAPGPDKIPTILLKKLAAEISIPLAIIFNKSLSEGYVPSQWKVAEVTAIFKKGNKNLTNNYRPVSLTSVLCKTLESFVTDTLQNYMESNNFFSECQHGFRKHRSCVTQLLEVMNDFTKLLDSGNNIDVLYLDFSKAFDTVPHERLLAKLKSYGISNNVHLWIKSFLSDRKQRVRVNNSYSDFSPITSGIPQGSILGPVLFIIFINDLPDHVKSGCKIFADDTKIYNSTDKSEVIQGDIDALINWSKTWQLKFNVQKCNVLHIGKSNNNEDYFMDSNKQSKINSVSHEKDIGVTFDAKLNFDKHISNIVGKANQMTGLLKRSFQFLDRDMFLKLYKAIVRPHLEYANVIWHPLFKRQLHSLESVQRRATKILNTIKDLPYADRLRYLKLPSIKYRQIRNDIIQTYKIIHNIDNIDGNSLFQVNNVNTRNPDSKLYKCYSRTNIRSNYFSNRVNNIWNSLSETTKNSPDMDKLKQNIDMELADLIYDFD